MGEHHVEGATQNLWCYDIIFPEDALYSPELLWVKPEGDKLRLGLSHLAVRAAKKLISIEVFANIKGTQIKKGTKIGSVENTKARWEIKSPLTGEVVAINPEMFGRKATAHIMNDAYGQGWVLELKKVSETDSELKQLHRGDTAEGKEWLAAQTKAIVPLHDSDKYAEDED